MPQDSEPVPLPVTVVVPVRNEERSLRACLETVKGFREVLVVDSGSTDATAAIARESGAQLLQFSWNGKYPKKRNWMLLNYAFSTEWVLFLDADEHLTPDFIAELRRVLPGSSHAGFWIPFEKRFLGGRLRWGIPQRKLALLRVGRGLYERIEEDRWSSLDMEIHEHPQLDGTVGRITSALKHWDDRGMHALIQRHNEYSSWEARRYVALLSGGKGAANLTRRQSIKYRLLRSRLFPLLYFLADYGLYLGLLDGWRGFVHAQFKATYFLQIREKILELERTGDPSTGMHADAQ